MSGDEVEVQDANLVVLLKSPLTNLAKGVELLSAAELKPYIKNATVNQALQVDAVTGAVGPVVVFESMRSQKAINVSQHRIEVYDRSGNREPDANGIAHIMQFLVKELEADISNVGANLTFTFSLAGQITAAKSIATKFQTQGEGFLPAALRLDGGAVRLFLTDQDDTHYTVSIEPRQNSPETGEVWMSSNANIVADALPTIKRLTALIHHNRQYLANLAQSLFSVTW